MNSHIVPDSRNKNKTSKINYGRSVKERAISMLRSGEKCKTVADRLGIPAGTVRSWKNRIKNFITDNNDTSNAVRQQALLEMLSGVPVKRTSFSLGVCESTLRSWKSRHLTSVKLDELKVSVTDEDIVSSGFSSVDTNTRSEWAIHVPKGKLSNRERYVYLVRESWNGLVKVGVATDIYARVATMQSCCPQKLSVFGYFITRDADKLESDIHIRFRNKCYSGEWFQLDNSDLLWFHSLDGFTKVEQ